MRGADINISIHKYTAPYPTALSDFTQLNTEQYHGTQ